MENAAFIAGVNEVAHRQEAGDLAGAIAGCEDLLADASLPDLDRSIVAINLATVLQISGGSPAQIEAAYDQAVRLEQRWLRCFAREHKVAWLVQVGRSAEATSILEDLRAEPWLQLADREWIGQNLAALRAG